MMPDDDDVVVAVEKKKPDAGDPVGISKRERESVLSIIS